MTPSNLQSLESLMSTILLVNRNTKIANSKCVFCNQPAVQFNDDLSRREYAISGLCQSCQNRVFGQ